MFKKGTNKGLDLAYACSQRKKHKIDLAHKYLGPEQ